MGTVIVAGVLLMVIALIVIHIIRKVRRGGSAFCSSCDCGCGGEDTGYSKAREKVVDDCCCSGGTSYHCHDHERP